MKHPFPYYIEDWIHWFAKRKDDLGNEIDFPYYKAWPIKLANYDIQFIIRSSDGFIRGVGLTNRQVETAVKIITKYKRQIKQKIDRDIDYIAIDKPLILPIRKVDRSFSIKTLDNYYIVCFPYNPNLVESMHKIAARSSGDFRWDKCRREWVVSKTERNLFLLYQFIHEHSNHVQYWNLDKKIQDHLNIVEEVCNDPEKHRPTLELCNNELVVVNSNKHLDNALKDVDFSNIPNAVFCADRYGLFVGKNLKNYVEEHYTNISKALTTPQHIILEKMVRLGTFIDITKVEQLMQTVDVDHWVFISYNAMSKRESSLINTAINIDTTSEKIFYSSHRSSFDDFLAEIIAINSKSMVIFVENLVLARRIIASPLMHSALKVLYLHGDISK